jgi:hypothetical protein
VDQNFDQNVHALFKHFCRKYFIVAYAKDKIFFPELVSPFTVSVISTIAAQGPATGYNLVYNQVPCS